MYILLDGDDGSVRVLDQAPEILLDGDKLYKVINKGKIEFTIKELLDDCAELLDLLNKLVDFKVIEELQGDGIIYCN